MSQIPIWDVISKHNQTKLQKEILKIFFEYGPSTRNNLNKSLGKEKRSKSYNKNLDNLIQLKLLSHEEYHKEFLEIKHPDLDDVEPDLRRLVRDAYQKRDFSCPKKIEKQRWLKALEDYQLANYNERVKGKIGESLYRLTIWGVIAHLRNEDKFPPHRVLFTEDKIESFSENRTEITQKDLELAIPHTKNSYVPDFIDRKWDYLCKNNDKRVVYHQLLDALLLANYYYENLNAEFARFQFSAIKDIMLHFLMPYRLTQPYADKWMTSILNDGEMSDFLIACLNELNEYYGSNQNIVREYLRIIKGCKSKGKITAHRFFKNNHFRIKLPEYFHHGYYYGDGFFGYRLSYFLNELDSGQIDYSHQLQKSYIKYRTKQKKNYMSLTFQLPNRKTSDKQTL